MQVMNETFYTRDMGSKLTAIVNIRQSFRHSQNNRTVEDKMVGPLTNLQMSSDLIEVTVFEGMRANVVARAKAYLDVVTGAPCDFAMGNEVFASGRDFGNRFAAQKIFEQTKMMLNNRKEPYASVLTICEMEVLPTYQKRGIATLVLDLLFHVSKPDYAAAMVLPSYKTMATGIVSNPKTDEAACGALFKGSRFHYFGKQPVSLGGIDTLVSVYVAE